MKEITLKFTDTDARVFAYFLRKLYGKDKRTSLERLCDIAVRQQVALVERHTTID